MKRRTHTALSVLIGLAVCAAVAVACQYERQTPVWAKHPESSSSLFRVVVGGRAGYINAAGRLVIAPRFDPFYLDTGPGDFFEGMARVSTGAGYQFIDESGKVVVFEGLKIQRAFTEGLVPAERKSSSDQNQFVLLSHEGKVVASVRAAWIGGFSEGLAAYIEPHETRGLQAAKTHPIGYIDRSGKRVIPATYAHAGPFSEGLAAVAIDGHCWVEGYRGSQRPAPSAPSQFTSCGPMPGPTVAYPCRHGYIDKTGKMVIPATFELAREFSEGRAAVRGVGLWGFIDKTGKLIIPYRFDSVKPFRDGLAAVRDGGWGYIDANGAFVISKQFDDADSFSDGLAAVRIGKDHYYINKSGEKVLGPYMFATNFVKGLAHVQTSATEAAWIDKNGKVIFVDEVAW